MDILLFWPTIRRSTRPGDIVERKQFTKSHVSASVAELEQRGYLQGEFREDRKTQYLALCPGAKPAVRAGQAARGGSYSHVHRIHGRGTDAHGADHKSDRLNIRTAL